MSKFLQVIAAAVLLATMTASSSADDCLADIWDNGTLSPGYIYPNWVRIPVGNYTAMLYDTDVGPENIRGITVVNFGNATDADIKAVVFRAWCNSANTGLVTMTYAGNYAESTGTYPAWTWSGTSPDFSGCAALWALGPGGFTLDLYVDIDPCPTPERTVQMGLPFNSVANTIWWGSVYDNGGCIAPWGDTRGPRKYIYYAYKEADSTYAAPGDTINYTIYYSRPGTVNLTSVTIMDTQPAYTHYVGGSGVPAPDTGWDPDFGPPVRLQWNIPPPHPVAGGPTARVTFALSVDWGNTEAFEPGSGDTAAPEGERLSNNAQIFFNGITGCGITDLINPPVTTVVRRYLFWKTADNDVLFSQTLGSAPDEMIYEIFLKNMSDIKTWWNVSVWDTVPPEIETFCQDCGFEDPCLGWTMTPNGCPAAPWGWYVSGGNTILSWSLLMKPNMTLAIRWKGKVKGTAGGGDTAVNRASIMSYGRVGVMGGTGHAGKPRNFTHQAPIILPTMYTSYMPFGTAENLHWSCPACSVVNPLLDNTYYIVFYPLNKKANFSLYRRDHVLDAFADFGGVSAQINLPVGGCMTGGADWDPGCKAERTPAVYHDDIYATCLSFTRTHHLYKLVSNSPLVWELLTGAIDESNDQITYTGASSLTYKGYTHYSFTRVCSPASDRRDDLYLVNTSSSVPTAVHVFWWDAASLNWTYQSSMDINTESQWVFAPSFMGHHKAISSDGELIVMKGIPALYDQYGNNNLGTAVPNRNNGYLISPEGSGEFYAYSGGPAATEQPDLVIGNAGSVNAVYDIYKYVPDNTLLLLTGHLQHLTPMLVDSSGRWVRIVTNVDVRPGLPYVEPDPNSHVYGEGYDGVIKDEFALYKVVLKSSSQIQVHSGRDIYSGYASGFSLYSITGTSGNEFWFHQSQSFGDSDKDPESCTSASPVMCLDFFCPKQGTAVQMVSGDGYSARYTTNAADECIAFHKLTNASRLLPPNRRNYKITSPNGTIACGFNVTCQMKQRLYSAPFLSQGVFYRIIAPPVVYLGQSFWITVVVVEQGGATKTDYDGITSFTSSDSFAKIEGTNMSGYDYNWMGVPTEDGVRIFVNVEMGMLGLQTIVGQDTLDGSINGLTTVMVVAADVKLSKEPKLTIASSGETIQFRICWSNYSSATAAGFVITDAVPMGTSYVPEAASLLFCGSGGPAVPTVIVAYGTASATTPATFNTLTSPTQTAPATTRWLRWAIRDVYVFSTGCVCFRVIVN